MDISSLYRTPARQRKTRLNLVTAAFTIRNNNKRANKLRAYTFKPPSIKERIEANRKLRSKSLVSDTPSLRKRTPISRYFHTFKL
jgi:hypothetical protein